MRGSSWARATRMARTRSRSSGVNTLGAELRERAADNALGHASLVEMLRDPAEEEREAGPEQEAGVDLLRARDDAVVQDVAALVGECLERGVRDLIDGTRIVRGDGDLVAAL